jgi:hypothetical protein
MQPSPPFAVELTQFGTWKIAVLGLALCAVAALSGWIASQPSLVTGATVSLILTGSVLVGFAVSLTRVRPVGLRWDGQCWHLGPPGLRGNEPWTGEVSVVLDLGSWMLLRFKHGSPSPLCRVRWLPAQRRGLEDRWHALRCAVYSPRLGPGGSAGSAP